MGTISRWGNLINISAPAVQVVPEPTTLVLLGIGLVGLLVAHRRRKK